jgi:hypothetical protein
MLSAMAIFDLIVERGLGAKAQALEDANWTRLVGDHLRE